VPIPSAAEPLLMRAMGSYLRAAPKTDLPPALRPLSGRHQKMLVRHKKEILHALDENKALRALVVEWLDDKPGIKRDEADTLRLAAARPDGWEEALGSRVGSAKKPTRRATKPAGDETGVARANERAKKAKEEARKARAEADKSVKAAERRAEQLGSQVETLTARVKAVEKELDATRKDAERARGEAERETRKARRRAEEAERSAKDSRKELERARAEIKRLSARSAPKAPAKKRAAPRAPKPPARRTVLRAPKGRLEDAPETLEAWLQTDEVHLLIDGYNVSKARGGFGDLTLETQRERLIQAVAKLARRAEVTATIVFDGSEVPPGTKRRHRAPVAVEYSRPDEIADDHLVAKLEALPNWPVIVVTNDKELQGRARKLGATVARSDQLLALIR